MSVRADLLDILACPKCKGPVKLLQKNKNETICCAHCQLAFPVRDGIPVMLIDEAEAIDEA